MVSTAAADGSGPAVGTRVVALVDQAGWAERVAVQPNRIAVLPDGASMAVAATLPVAGLTALRALRLGGMLLGRSVLVTGASGGVGHIATQLASRSGARVVGVARHPDRLRSLFGSGNVEFVDASENAQGPFDLILESVGGASLSASLRLVEADGLVVVFGNSSSEDSTVSFGGFAGHPRARLYAFFVYLSGEPPTFGSDLGILAGEVAAGRLQPQIGLESSWRDPLGALEALRARNLHGKAVLTIG